MKTSYTVIYRTGGTENCKCRRQNKNMLACGAARPLADDIERMGYKALIHRTADLDAHGMPEGWDA